ncbi:MAG TPA: GTPase Era [Gammaproteobacteria bacterium]|nr:GTPase Era [Gammaproteobacteria bacterium]
MIESAAPRCGHVAVIGRPNVGKSTLVNRLIGHKVSITSRKPQTTRLRILGIAHVDGAQVIFVDTPGWQARPRTPLDKLMNRQIDAALAGMDAVLMVADARGWQPEDDAIAAQMLAASCPRFLALNKIDRIDDKSTLLPLLADLGQRLPEVEIVPISALKGKGTGELLAAIARRLPEREPLYPDDQITDRSERFLAAELVREQVMRQLGDELPYAANVVVTKFEDRPERTHIEVEIWVEKPGQKAIVIGKGGARLKEIGTAARQSLERLLDRPVFLGTQVRQREGWTEDPRALAKIERDGQ